LRFLADSRIVQPWSGGWLAVGLKEFFKFGLIEKQLHSDDSEREHVGFDAVSLVCEYFRGHRDIGACLRLSQFRFAFELLAKSEIDEFEGAVEQELFLADLALRERIETVLRSPEHHVFEFQITVDNELTVKLLHPSRDLRQTLKRKDLRHPLRKVLLQELFKIEMAILKIWIELYFHYHVENSIDGFYTILDLYDVGLVLKRLHDVDFVLHVVNSERLDFF
jgi:hypothetical protein